MGDVTPDLHGPIPRDVYEKLSRESVGYIDFWRTETLKAEVEVERLREALEAFALDRWGTTNPILVTDKDKPLQETYFKAVHRDYDAHTHRESRNIMDVFRDDDAMRAFGVDREALDG